MDHFYEIAKLKRCSRKVDALFSIVNFIYNDNMITQTLKLPNNDAFYNIQAIGKSAPQISVSATMFFVFNFFYKKKWVFF